MHNTHTVFRALTVLTLAILLVLPAAALEITVDPTAQFCFSAEDFSTLDGDEGIFLTAVPSSNIATVFWGDRALQAGDALPASALDELTLFTQCVTQQDVAVEYYTVSNGAVSAGKALKLSILPQKNEPPTVKDGTLETYKNIANSGQLEADDPEGRALTYTLVESPKRGTVELCADGSFTYTPDHNKVGNDQFTFTVTDDAGHISDEAKVMIKIKKPTDKQTYADMQDDADAFAAMWLKEEGLYTGSSIAGNLCFSPENNVSRGEYLVMVMKLVGADASQTELASGFADESATPVWMQPYIVSALGNGMISGISSETGVEFRPQATLTKAEAAVMLQKILQLPVSDTASVFSQESDSTIPVWAAEAAAALSKAGLPLDIGSQDEPLTYRDAARLLYSVNCLLGDESTATFHWVQ